MKTRIKDNTIRYRLVKSEVTQLAAGDRVRQTTTFAPGQTLACSIETADIADLEIGFDAGEITVRIPRLFVERWAASDAVGIRGRRRIDHANEVSILIEKDFQCLHPGHERLAGAYPHPMADALRTCGAVAEALPHLASAELTWA